MVALPADETPMALSETPDLPYVSIPEVGGFDRSISISPGLVDRRLAVRAALKAGAFGIFIAMIPVLGIVLTGSLAVFFYRREKRLALPASTGARLGGAAGIVVFAINTLFTIPILVFHAQQQSVDMLTEMAQKLGVNTSTPQFQESVHNLFTPSGMLSSFIIALVLSSAGGALAALIFRPSSRP